MGKRRTWGRGGRGEEWDVGKRGGMSGRGEGARDEWGKGEGGMAERRCEGGEGERGGGEGGTIKGNRCGDREAGHHLIII